MNKKKIIYLIFTILSFKTSYIGSQSRMNIEKTLYYLNKQLNLEVSDQQLVSACSEKDNGNINQALETLNLNSSESTKENKQKVLNAACHALKFSFKDPTDPTLKCNVPLCPENRKKCSSNEWVLVPKDNTNCQKPDLNGACLEFAPCKKYD